MSLEDEQEHYTADAGRQEADGERDEPPRKLPPINNPLQPPQPPASDPPSDENPSSWRQNTKLGLEIFGLLVLCAYTIFSCLQWLQIRWTNGLTREALTHSESTLNQTTMKMQGQTNATNRLAKAQEIANSNALASDRPWIGGWIHVTGFAVGQSPEAICTFINAGKRPAFIERSNCTVVMDKYDMNTIKEDPEKPGRSILVPGQTTVAPMRFFRGGTPNFIQNGDQMTTTLVNAFNAGDVHIKVIGSTTYRDVKTGEVHHTKFCMRYLPSLYGRAAGFYECNSDTDVD